MDDTQVEKFVRDTIAQTYEEYKTWQKVADRFAPYYPENTRPRDRAVYDRIKNGAKPSYETVVAVFRAAGLEPPLPRVETRVCPSCAARGIFRSHGDAADCHDMPVAAVVVVPVGAKAVVVPEGTETVTVPAGSRVKIVREKNPLPSGLQEAVRFLSNHIAARRDGTPSAFARGGKAVAKNGEGHDA